MAGSLGTLTLDLIAKIGGFTGPMDQAGRAAKKTSKEMTSAAQEASLAWSALAGAAVHHHQLDERCRAHPPELANASQSGRRR